MRDDVDVSDAKKIIRSGGKFLEQMASEKRAWHLGGLWFFDEEEYAEAIAIKELVEGYLRSETVKRPLSIAVFGPPGSGKSFAVREIQKAMNVVFSKNYNLYYEEVNLTQISTPSELYIAMKEIYRSNEVANKVSRRTAVPFVFFDEFDAPCGGVPLGWLNWFLAPMQDSEIGHGDNKIKLKKAVYFFAGGTAPTLSEFSAVHAKRFIDAKGPDFVSRLRGYLNIKGPNDEQNTCSRRAVVVRTSLGTMDKAPNPLLSADLETRIFNEGRFKHGARSISVLLEMAVDRAQDRIEGGNGPNRITYDDLPPDHIKSIHADQGPLDPETIDGLIGLSIGKDVQNADSGNPHELFLLLTKKLWSLGAAISYGGKWDRKLTISLLNESQRLRKKTATDEERRVELFSRGKTKVVDDPAVIVVPISSKYPGILANESDEIQSFITSFRMRWSMACRSVARILIAGNVVTYAGRMPGVLEEAVLALALQQPIYVCGGLCGAGAMIGELLGLAEKRSNGKYKSMTDTLILNSLSDEIIKHRKLFSPPLKNSLPLDAAEAIDFISIHSIGGPFWPSNGLSIEENRLLFISQDPDQITKLICRGLLRRFGY